jgi:hypothetical protein
MSSSMGYTIGLIINLINVALNALNNENIIMSKSCNIKR